MSLILKILRSKRGSVGIGTAVTAGLVGAAGSAAAAGVGALTRGGDPLAATNQANLGQDRKNSLGALGQQQDFAQGLQMSGGQGVNAQQQLLQQLLLQSQGGGPNPALAQLNNATGANVAQTAALMGSQRGASQNAGLIGRQAGMAGAGIQQDAAGQAAVLQAQQQLAAQNSAGQMAGQLVTQQGNALNNAAGTALGVQNGGLGAAQAANTQTGALNQQSNALLGQGLQNTGAAIGQTLIGAMAPKPAAPSMTVPSVPSIAPSAPTKGPSLLNFAQGGEVPGDDNKLKPGDSEDNDVVPVMLSPGEIVIPRSYASNPHAAAAFAHACALYSSKGNK